MGRGREQSRWVQKKLLRQRIVETAQRAIWEDFRAQRGGRYVAILCGLAAVAIAASTLGGYLTGRLDLVSQLARIAPMAPATSIAVLLLGIGITVIGSGWPQAFPVAYAASGMAWFIALLRLMELVTELDLTFSGLFPVAPESLATGGWMGLPSITGLTLASLALLVPHNARLFRAIFPLSLTLMVLAGAFVLGHVYGRPMIFEGHHVPLRLPTATCFLLLGTGLLLLGVTQERAISGVIEDEVESYQRDLEELTSQLRRDRWVLSTMIESVPVGLALHDGRDLKVKWHNQEYTRLLEPQHLGADLVGKEAPEYITDIGTLVQAYRATAGGERRSVTAHPVLSGEAGLRFFDWVTVPVPTEHEEYYDVLELGYEVTDQVLARQRIEELARELAVLIDTAPSGILFFNAEGKVVRINPAARTMLGFTEEVMPLDEPQAMPPLEIMDEAGRTLDLQRSARHRALRGETVLGMIQRTRPAGMEPFWVSVSAVPIRQHDDSIAGAVVVLTDVTALQEAQSEAERLSGELQSILDHAPNGIVFYDTVGNILRMNRAARDILGYTDEIIALPPMERFARHEVVDERGEPIRPGRGVIEAALGGATVLNQIARFHNTPRGAVWLSVAAGPIEDQEGKLEGVVAVFADVTALHEAQEEARRTATYSEQQRQELEAILGSIADAVMVWAPDGRVERANEMARSIMPGYEEVGKGQEMIDDIKSGAVAMADENLQPLPPDQIPLARALRGEVLQNVTLHVTWPNGLARWLSVSAAPILDEHGVVVRVVTVFRDVTAVRERQQELERLVEQRTAALLRNQARLRAATADLTNAEQKERQRLASAIHDEVAQTLGAIKMHLGMLGRRCPDAQEAVVSIATMVDEANVQSRAIMTELNPPVLQRIGLVAALEWWADEVRRRDGLKVQVVSGADFGRLEGYLETTLFQAVKELIQNARKHAQATLVWVRVECQGDWLQIEVADNGIGFDPAAVEVAEGAGYGLFSIRERMAYLGGEFSLETAPDAGVQVRLRLPVQCQPQTPAQSSERA